MVIGITNESEDGALSTDSPLSNDSDNYGESSNGGVVLKKGPWTSAEDAILVDYVKKHGEGNWNAVQKHSGLWRCGKSCRLRWANHLRPNLKKGAFTSEEERVIIELHAKMGNKWARMAAHLPGRTDNEIKNYWNTRIKRRQRAGLPLYPSELCLQTHQENHLSSPGIYGGDKGFHDVLQSDDYETPDVMVDSFNILSYTPQFPNTSASGSLSNGFGFPQFHSYVPQMVGFQKCAEELDEPMSDYSGGVADEAPPFDRAQDDACENKMFQSFGLCFQYDPDHTNKLLPVGENQDIPFMSNGYLSASKPLSGAEKLELPSLQYEETGLGVYNNAPKSFDSFFHSPLSGQLPSCCPSPRSSGLLEALLYEAKSLSKSDNQFSDKVTSSTISHGDLTGGSTLNTCSTEFKGNLDPTSPLGNSMGSSFNRCTPPTPTNGSTLEEKIHDEGWILDGKTTFDCSRPDAILGSCWVEQSASSSKKRSHVTDAISSLLGDDMGDEYSTTTYASVSNWGLSSCTWNNMPAVCQMSDLP
ncbi:hypothetical protein ACJIZ3_018638 [Penstemon smallii]|uniref:Transcription factor n=1 Tax=Penstemon smallii TaxID=265156 RepID=A0ABD3SYV7_9LAMI